MNQKVEQSQGGGFIAYIDMADQRSLWNNADITMHCKHALIMCNRHISSMIASVNTETFMAIVQSKGQVLSARIGSLSNKQAAQCGEHPWGCLCVCLLTFSGEVGNEPRSIRSDVEDDPDHCLDSRTPHRILYHWEIRVSINSLPCNATKPCTVMNECLTSLQWRSVVSDGFLFNLHKYCVA